MIAAKTNRVLPALLTVPRIAGASLSFLATPLGPVFGVPGTERYRVLPCTPTDSISLAAIAARAAASFNNFQYEIRLIAAASVHNEAHFCADVNNLAGFSHWNLSWEITKKRRERHEQRRRAIKKDENRNRMMNTRDVRTDKLGKHLRPRTPRHCLSRVPS